MGTIAGISVASIAAYAGTAASVIGAGVSAYGASQQADAQQKAANYQAQVAKNNAIVAGQNADAVQRQAENKAVNDVRAAGARVGAQRAALGAAGVDPNTGSAVAVQSSTAQVGAMAADQDMYQGDLASRSYLAQAGNSNATAALDTAAGENAANAGSLAMAGSLLSGASQVSSKWQAWQNQTNPPTATPANTNATTSTGLFGGAGTTGMRA